MAISPLLHRRSEQIGEVLVDRFRIEGFGVEFAA